MKVKWLKRHINPAKLEAVLGVKVLSVTRGLLPTEADDELEEGIEVEFGEEVSGATLHLFDLLLEQRGYARGALKTPRDLSAEVDELKVKIEKLEKK